MSLPGSFTPRGFWGGIWGAPTVNLIRTITATTSGWNGVFRTFYGDDVDTLTFDLQALLASGEVVDQIDRFDLTVSDVDYNGVDGSPASRIWGSVAIDGSKVSQRFGAWLDLRWIQYIAELVVRTNSGNTITVSADVNVRAALE